MNSLTPSLENPTFEENKTEKQDHREENRPPKFSSKRRSKTHFQLNDIVAQIHESNETFGEFYGLAKPEYKDIFMDLKEKQINDFLDFEKVDWGDPTEKAHSFYNNKRLMIQRKVNSNNSSINDLDMDASPLLNRRKNKCSTLSPNLNSLRLKEAFSVDGLNVKEKIGIRILPTKFI